MTSSEPINSLNFTPPSDSLDFILEPDEGQPRAPLTRLVATLGPNSSSVPALTALLQAGMQIARFDFSYGSSEWHLETQRSLAQAMDDTGLPCAVMLDILGTEVTVVGRDEGAPPVELTKGDEVTLTCNANAPFSKSVIPISCRSLQEGTGGIGLKTGADVFVGQYLYTGSENVSAYLTVIEVSDQEARCVCNNTCRLQGRQLTVHIADMERNGPVLADKDIEYLKAWEATSTQHVDYLSISFCRTADDVRECRRALNSLGLDTTRVVAKIEDREGLINHEAIIDAADGIIFSRGNLGIDLPAEKMFLAQKLVLSACNYAGKPVIVARVVDTMIEAPRPTRAEATDVANLVLDGCDGILLGAETWMGRDPAWTAKTVLDIARQAEKVFNHSGHYMSMLASLGGLSNESKMSKVEALASSAVRAADKLAAPLIIAFTTTGNTARIVAKYRAPCPVIAVVVPEPRSKGGASAKWGGTHRANQCLLYRGVLPWLADHPTKADTSSETDQQLRFAIDYATREGMVKDGDQVVISQCPHGQDSGSVKVLQVTTEIARLKSLALGSTADFSQLLDDDDSAADSPDDVASPEGSGR